MITHPATKLTCSGLSSGKPDKSTPTPSLLYFLDLSPCYFWLFPLLTNRMVGLHFNRVQDIAKAVNLELRSISQNDYHTAFNKWLSRLIKRIQSGGAYFEGQYYNSFHLLSLLLK